MAAELPAGKNYIEVQGSTLRGLHGLVQLAARVGRRQDPQQGARSRWRRRRREAALKVMARRRDVDGRARPVAVERSGGRRSARRSSPASAAFMVNYPFVYAAVKADAPSDLPQPRASRRWPERRSRTTPAPGLARRVTTSASARFSTHQFRGVRGGAVPDAARPSRCVLRQGDGLPPVSEALYQDPQIRKAYPFAGPPARDLP